jgi:hypothetical protein
MANLVWQTIDNDKFNVFIRDLGEDLNSNFKHIIEDSIKNNKNKINTKKHVKQKNKKVVKKADLIRLEQNKQKILKQENEDKIKINFYLDNLVIKDIFNNLKNIKSENGIVSYKFKLLDKLWNDKNLRKTNMENIMGLYFELINLEISDENNKKIINKITNKLDDYDLKLYILKSMGHLLPPLNIWEKKENKLEDWQLEVFKNMKIKKSILVKAPTSSGKSFIGMGAAVIHRVIAYICPADPVVYQVGSHFTKMGYKVHYLCSNIEYNSFTEKVNVFLGTPEIFEKMLYKINIKFDYAVFDEIHGLNKIDDGHIYENLIKLIDCPFIALSATIKNINKLHEIFKKINPNKEIKLIEYNKRFINQQRWLWKNNKLIELHPLASINLNDIKENKLLEYNLPFSPKDLAVLWEKIEEEFEELCDEDDKLYEIINNMSPDNYFSNIHNNKILTLDQSKDYEIFLKKKLQSLNIKYENNINKIVNSFSIDSELKDNNDDIVDFLLESKKNKMFPMLLFNTELINCIELFNKIHYKLIESETKNYPYHYDILNKKNDLYKKYLDKLEIFKSKIKINKSSKDPMSDIDNKIEQFNQREKYNYIIEIQEYYELLLNKLLINNNKNKKCYINLKKEYENFILNPDFCSQNIFKKHPNYCFTDKEPMGDNKIREIKKNIKNTLGINLDYNHPLIQLLKRGIGIYIEGMPIEYNWIVQKLLSSKEIGIVISDRTLCLGIDCPVLTSCIVGMNNSTFTNDDYLQMSGRAGRRGYDNKGNIIFYNINYNKIMRGELPDIIGSNKNINTNYDILNLINNKYNSNNVYNNIINNDRNVIQIKNKLDDPSFNKLLWVLREEENSIEFINTITKIERKLFLNNNIHEKQIYILNIFNNVLFNKKYNIIEIYKNNKINNNILKNVSILNKYIKYVILIYNYLNKKKYMILCTELKNIYNNLKCIIVNYSGINYFDEHFLHKQ